MKIFDADQVRAWDAYTIQREAITSDELMERAAGKCVEWLHNHFPLVHHYEIYCGSGNNGGDGLVIARLLFSAGLSVSIYLLPGSSRSKDFTINLQRVEALDLKPMLLDTDQLSSLPSDDAVVIDALFGTGLKGSLSPAARKVVQHLNQITSPVVCIDLPSGLSADGDSDGLPVVRGAHTLSFQTPKLAFFFTRNRSFTGELHLLDIGLDPAYYETTSTRFNLIDEGILRQRYQLRTPYSHKYHFGHALLLAGSQQMMGAAILCARACLRSGAGLVSVATQIQTQSVIQIALPEAIALTNSNLSENLEKKAAVAIGPGLEQNETNAGLLKELLTRYHGNIVIDASGLSLLASQLSLLDDRPAQAVVLTPHTGEFDRLFGNCQSEHQRMIKAIDRARELKCYLVLKGPFTMIACPDGNVFINATGNAGMATAGTGDVLTGIITGLLAQEIEPATACILGVYLHGYAGNLAAREKSQESMIASDLIEQLGKGFLHLKSVQQGAKFG